MKKICLVIVGLYVQLLGAFSQTVDSTQYKNRRLKVNEINLVNSYYNQDGNHSAVTGGIGTQELSDYVTDINLTLSKYNKNNHKVDLDIDVGIEYYTSASSDKIDPTTISSASSHDIHFYPSVTRTVTNEQKGTKFDFTGSIGTESYYFSSGYGVGFAKKSKDKSREFEVKATAYLDIMKKILPIELRTLETGGLTGAYNQHKYPWVHRNSFNTEYTLSQIVNNRLQLLFLLDLAYQQGYLSLPFHRIYFNNNTEGIEQLPSQRFKIPIGIRSSYFLGDRFVIRSYYRFYHDNWGLNAHTIDNEIAYKITPFFSVAPFYRYYTQNAIRYFAPYKENAPTDLYYSSDYDLSDFHSNFFGTGFRIVPPKGIFGDPHWNMIELRYGHYKRSDGFHADVISMNLKFD
jgi:hypothetical protein